MQFLKSGIFLSLILLVGFPPPAAKAVQVVTGEGLLPHAFSVWKSSPTTSDPHRRWLRKFYWRKGGSVYEGDCPANISSAQASRDTCGNNVTVIPQERLLALWGKAVDWGMSAHDRAHGILVDPSRVAFYAAQYERLLEAESAMMASGKATLNAGSETLRADQISARIWQVGRCWRLAEQWEAVAREFLDFAGGTGLHSPSFLLDAYAGYLPGAVNRYRREERASGNSLGRVGRLRTETEARYFDPVLGNSWAVLADDPGTVRANRFDWLTLEEATRGSRSPRQGEILNNGEDGEIGCGEIFGRGWHVPSFADLFGARNRMKHSRLGQALGDSLVWTTTFAGNGQRYLQSYRERYHYRHPFNYYYVVRVQNGWFEKRYTQQSSYAGSRQPVLCVCGPRVTDPPARVSTQDCRAHLD
jgi:hypothetical protein